MLKNIIYVTFCLLLQSCISKDIKYEVESEPSKLVLYSILIDGETPQATLSHSLPPLYTYTEKPYVKNATVLLLENGVVTDTLRYDSAGVYSGRRQWLPQQGSFYHFRVTAAGYPDIESKPELLPKKIRLQKVEFRDSTNLRFFPSIIGSLRLKLGAITLDPNNVFAKKSYTYYPTTTIFGILDYPFYLDEFGASQCERSYISNLKKYTFENVTYDEGFDIIGNSCLNANSVDIDFDFYTHYPLYPYGEPDSMLVYLYRSNRILSDVAIASHKQDPDYNKGGETIYIPTNIQNGYGFVTLMTKDSTIVKLR